MKMIRLAAVILLAALLTGACALADVVVTDNVNMRSGPSSDYRVICVIPAETHVEYVDEKCRSNGEVSWYQVKYEGKKGWIYADYAEYDGIASVIASAYDLTNIDAFVDVSAYFGKDLAASAREIGLIGFQETLHDGVKKYFDDKLSFSGVEKVDAVALLGGEYSVFGVAPGMEISEAAMMLDEQGLVFSSLDETSMSFDCVSGAASTIRLIVEDNIITYIEWTIR